MIAVYCGAVAFSAFAFLLMRSLNERAARRHQSRLKEAGRAAAANGSGLPAAPVAVMHAAPLPAPTHYSPSRKVSQEAIPSTNYHL